MQNTTVGQLLVNESLPEDMRDYNRVLDKKGLRDLLREVAQKHPEKYREISHQLSQVGRQAAQESGGMSFGLQHLRKSKAGAATQKKVERQLNQILSRQGLDDKQRAELIIRATGREMKPQQAAILKEAIASGNPLAMQVLSGARGNEMNLASLLGSDLLYADHHDRPIPIPVLNSYSQGLRPEEYWAGAYGARKGVTATKFATRDAGFLSKQLNQVAHRLVVDEDDYEDEEQRNIMRGLPVDTADMDNEGSLLAIDAGPYKRNTTLTPKVLKHLSRLGHKRIAVRSAAVGGTPAGGVYARDVGIRETGRLPGRGEMVGLSAAQALSEPLSQGQLSAKHSGGVAGEEKSVSGFKYINQLVQVPKAFKDGAAHATLDGKVQRIEKGPAGGNYVTIDGEQHYVGQGYALKVKKGDDVEAGDVISEGIPNPSIITKYKGIGEGRRYFSKEFRRAMQDAGLPAHRRNVELLSRGLINHVKLTDEYEDWVPDDVIPYSTLEHKWQPREGHEVLEPRRAAGKFLERPILHYTIGTKVTPTVLRDLEEFGVKDVTVHPQAPPFQPEMIRGMASMQHDPDWMTRMYGSGQKQSLLDAVHRGSTSEERGTSFVPSLARSVDFGRDQTAKVVKPGLGTLPSSPKPNILPGMPQEDAEAPAPPPKPATSWFGGKLSPSGFSSKAPMPKQASCSIGEFIEKEAENNPYSTDSLSGNGSSSLGSSTGGSGGSSTGALKGIGSLGSANKNPYQAQAPAAQTMLNPTQGTNWSSSFSPGQNMMNSPMGQYAPQMIQGMNQMMPGIGGVAGLGMMMSPSAMKVLTSKSPYALSGQRGAAGYDSSKYMPQMGGFGNMFGGGGNNWMSSGGGGSGTGSGYAGSDDTGGEAAAPEGEGNWLETAGDAAKFVGEWARPDMVVAGAGRLISQGANALKSAPVVGRLIPQAATTVPKFMQTASWMSKTFPRAAKAWQMGTAPFRAMSTAANQLTGFAPKASVVSKLGMRGASRFLGAASGALSIFEQPTTMAYRMWNAKTPEEMQAALRTFSQQDFNREQIQAGAAGGLGGYIGQVSSALSRPYNAAMSYVPQGLQGLIDRSGATEAVFGKGNTLTAYGGQTDAGGEAAHRTNFDKQQQTQVDALRSQAKWEEDPQRKAEMLQQATQAEQQLAKLQQQRRPQDDPLAPWNLSDTEKPRLANVEQYNTTMVQKRREAMEGSRKDLQSLADGTWEENFTKQQVASGQPPPNPQQMAAAKKRAEQQAIKVLQARGNLEGQYSLRQYQPGAFNSVPWLQDIGHSLSYGSKHGDTWAHKASPGSDYEQIYDASIPDEVFDPRIDTANAIMPGASSEFSRWKTPDNFQRGRVYGGWHGVPEQYLPRNMSEAGIAESRAAAAEKAKYDQQQTEYDQWLQQNHPAAQQEQQQRKFQNSFNPGQSTLGGSRKPEMGGFKLGDLSTLQGGKGGYYRATEEDMPRGLEEAQPQQPLSFEEWQQYKNNQVQGQIPLYSQQNQERMKTNPDQRRLLMEFLSKNK